MHCCLDSFLNISSAGQRINSIRSFKHRTRQLPVFDNFHLQAYSAGCLYSRPAQLAVTHTGMQIAQRQIGTADKYRQIHFGADLNELGIHIRTVITWNSAMHAAFRRSNAKHADHRR